MELRIAIQMNKAAFEYREAEVARILHKLAERLTDGDLQVHDSESLVDFNGNRVGEWEVTP